MRIVGLTGGIASGKSTVSRSLSKCGITVIDCDLIARQVVEPGTPTLAAIAKSFGKKVLLDTGELNRPVLGKIIFNDKSQNKKLGQIIGPAISWQIQLQIGLAFAKGKQLVVVDAPTLYETKKLVAMCGEIIVVAVDEATQLERLMARDKSTREEAMSRINSQLATQKKIEHPSTTEVLMNDGTREELQIKVDKMVKRLQTRAGVLHRVLTFPGILAVLGFGIYGLVGYSRM